MRMTALEQIAEGRRVLALHNISVDRQLTAVRAAYPDKDFDRGMAQVVAASEAYDWLNAPEPHDVETLAPYIAGEHGAFPWDGPVGNGLTVNTYQHHLRCIAGEHITAWRELGLDTEAQR